MQIDPSKPVEWEICDGHGGVGEPYGFSTSQLESSSMMAVWGWGEGIFNVYVRAVVHNACACCVYVRAHTRAGGVRACV